MKNMASKDFEKAHLICGMMGLPEAEACVGEKLMNRLLTRNLILRWLKESTNWGAGHYKFFKYGKWNLAIRKMDESRLPFRFGIYGCREGNNGPRECWTRLYGSIEKALLHPLNGFNECADIRNRYSSLDEALSDPFCWKNINTKISYFYRDASNNKVYATCILRGEMTEEENKLFKSALIDGKYFRPAQFGLPEKINEDTITDVEFLEWQGFEIVDDTANVNMSPGQLVIF